MSDDGLQITPELTIPVAELTFRASRAGGPGGQHVNTSSTRVELVWDVLASPSLTEKQRDRIRRQLANRISAAGLLALAEGGSRSQHRNREEVTARFVTLLQEALYVPPPRRKSRPGRAARERRLKAKKHRSETKRLRRTPPHE
jgi:ribosome-associated protein